MSLVLALETATTACSAALCAADGTVVAEAVTLEGPAHSERLLPGVHDVFAAAGANWADVVTVAVGIGPGAFTGLRIGVATARALAQADGGVELVGVPTTAALALALAEVPEAAGRRLVPLIDGKRREVFAAVYDAPPGDVALEIIDDISVVKADDLGEWLAPLGAVTAGGDGSVLYADLLPASVLRAVGVPVPTAAMVGKAAALGVPGLVSGPDAVLPLYGRVPDAARWVAPASPSAIQHS